ncbi:MAG: glycine cleavage system protein GcvH [Clostridia bacterium]|nr:glycine cleavage system protein GcvH [Clostridia bacterium]MBR3295565.1 glycine cleavage system protein GcvH [Clostridia bacterium]
MSKVLKELKYLDSHEWVRDEGEGVFTIGISDYAQESLGDIVFVNLPEVGDEVEIGGSFADVESVKAVSDVYSPVSGTVCAINEALLDSPELINEDAYEAWFIKVENGTLQEGLMDSEQYEEFCKNEE